MMSVVCFLSCLRCSADCNSNQANATTKKKTTRNALTRTFDETKLSVYMDLSLLVWFFFRVRSIRAFKVSVTLTTFWTNFQHLISRRLIRRWQRMQCHRFFFVSFLFRSLYFHLSSLQIHLMSQKSFCIRMCETLIISDKIVADTRWKCEIMATQKQKQWTQRNDLRVEQSWWKPMRRLPATTSSNWCTCLWK